MLKRVGKGQNRYQRNAVFLAAELALHAADDSKNKTIISNEFRVIWTRFFVPESRQLASELPVPHSAVCTPRPRRQRLFGLE